MPTNYEDMTVEQLTAILADMDRERISLKERGREITQIRNRKLQEEHAAEHGLTHEQYQQVKRDAVDNEIPLTEALREGRKRALKGQLQVTKVEPIQTKAKAVSQGQEKGKK